ncbi:SNF2 family N-terminal domain-containing protein [Schizophyllum commune]
MSTPMMPNNMGAPMQGSPMRPDAQLAQLLSRISLLRQNPAEAKFPGELQKLTMMAQQFHMRNVAMANGHANANGTNLDPAQQAALRATSPLTFNEDQVNVLKAQVQAFKYLSRGMPVPEPIQAAMRVPHNTLNDLQKLMTGQDVNTRIADSAVKAARGETVAPEDAPKMEDPDIDPAKLPKGPFLEEDVNSGIYPYNSYRHPFSHLRRQKDADPTMFESRLQRLLVPTVMPTGLDAHQIIAERDSFIDARINQRIRELENIPATIGDGGLEDNMDLDVKEEKVKDEHTGKDLSSLVHPAPNAHGKLRALIELKSLKLIDKQRSLRALVAERLIHGAMLPITRTDFRRTRKPTVRDARKTEKLERDQRVERERRAKHKHVAQLNVICTHGQEVRNASTAVRDRLGRLAKSVLHFHTVTEKEEQKRIERISKERLKALKADDEEAYMKLIDTAKDTRITHLLRQTDSYLDSLAQAVRAQQSEGGSMVPLPTEATNEATFGAQVDPYESTEDKSKVDYYSIAHRIPEKITKQPSLLVGGTLKEYQLKGLQWMVSLYNNRLNGILADEMGLGKTIQTISLITFLIEVKRQRGPYLVIVPLSTMTNWAGEFAKWAPAVKVISYKGNPAQRRALQGELRNSNFQVLLTTYEYIIKDRPHLSKLRWVHMIIDEGHRMKNTQSKLSQTLTTYYRSNYRLILTGTPLQNNLPELWSLLNFVLPKVFNSVKSFDEWFNTPFANAGTGDKIELNEEEALLIIRRLHKVLRPFLLRRLKKDVESELPDKQEKVIKVRMSALQSQLYKQMKKYKMIANGKGKGQSTGGVKGLSNELMQLRKICQHPFLFDEVEDVVNTTQLIDEKIIRSSGKVELLSRILPKLFATDHRVLIFFQMTKVMDIMEDFLKMMGWKYLRLDGGTKTEERASYVQLFNAKDSDIRVFILSTRAGGLGLNLQTADTVIIFDSDWNPHADLQAQDRAHRIGQTKAVLILRFITEKSVEEAMYQRARYKLDIDGKVIQAGRFDNKSSQEEQEEFLRAILEADQEEESEESGDMNDEELNMLLARDDSEREVFQRIDAQREREAEEMWRAAGNRGKPPPPLMQLEELPECYQKEEPFVPDELEEVAEGRGTRKRNVVSYNDGLSDDAWAMALEEGEDLEELSERNRKRRTVDRLRDDSLRGTPLSDTESRDGRSNRRKGKGRMAAPDFGGSEIGSKRKRGGGKSTSVTPSIDGYEDETPSKPSKRRKVPDVSPEVRERMKKAFNECYQAVCAVEDTSDPKTPHRKRCELFREVPSRSVYPGYRTVIKQPIALSHLRKRAQSNYYKDVQAYRADWKLMFRNAYTFNEENSWVWLDAKELERVFDETYDRVIAGSGLPGAGPPAEGGSAYDSALTPMDEDDRPLPPRRTGSKRQQVVSDDEYNSEEE